MHAIDTPKLINIAAKMLDRRRPKRTRTESEAQPIAERMAVISATSDMGAGMMWKDPDKPTSSVICNRQEFYMRGVSQQSCIAQW